MEWRTQDAEVNQDVDQLYAEEKLGIVIAGAFNQRIPESVDRPTVDTGGYGVDYPPDNADRVETIDDDTA